MSNQVFLLQLFAWFFILSFTECQIIPRTEEQISSNVLVNKKENVQGVYRVRPFRKSTEKVSKALPNDNELNDDRPTKVWIPGGLEFSCKGRSPGYYSDPSPMSKCQVYHMCMPDGRKYSMLCGIGTIFNQITFVCDHWYNYRCNEAESDYKRNDRLWNEYLSPISDSLDEYDEEDYETTPHSI